MSLIEQTGEEIARQIHVRDRTTHNAHSPSNVNLTFTFCNVPGKVFGVASESGDTLPPAATSVGVLARSGEGAPDESVAFGLVIDLILGSGLVAADRRPKEQTRPSEDFTKLAAGKESKMQVTDVESIRGARALKGDQPLGRGFRPSWRPVVVFLGLAVGLSWLVMVAEVLGWGAAAATGAAPAVIFFAVPRMAPPAIAAYIARRWWEHGYFADAGLRWPGWRFGAIAWILPIALAVLALGISLPVYPFDWSALGGAAGQLAVSLTVAVPIIAVIAFGEEFGWRGYLLPRLMVLLGPWPGLLAQGAIWGAWHAPLILLLGYGYPGHRFLGVPLYIVTFTLFGVIIGWLQLASRSVVASCIAHGAYDASVGLPLLLLQGANPAVAGVLFSPLGWTVLLLTIGVLVVTGALPRAMASVERRPAEGGD